uniref:1-acylglycerol-3-phosphate O-acyltransferase n=1 Tax=Anas zonorhyncha TaxID=75864 RepID=A0A8B9V765_9AVES
MWLPLAALALVLARAVLWRSRSARFFLKMFLFHGWVLLLALLALPLCALRGRDVENMRILRGLLQHVKHLYGIRMAVRGAQHFPPRQPYVVVSNHQSSLDLLGPGLGFPRGDAQPRGLHAALQARSLPPRRAGPGPRGPHRHLVLPALLQQAGAALHARAVRDPGAAPAAHAGAGPRGRPGADGAGARRHAAGLRRALGRAQPHGADPRPTVTHGCPTAAPHRPHGGPTAAPRRSRGGPVAPSSPLGSLPAPSPTAAADPQVGLGETHGGSWGVRAAGPIAGPTAGPLASPITRPTERPTAGPMASPTASPPPRPTVGPTASPIAGPTVRPTARPTASPTA